MLSLRDFCFERILINSLEIHKPTPGWIVKKRHLLLTFLIVLSSLKVMAGQDYLERGTNEFFEPASGIYAPHEEMVVIPLSGKWTESRNGKKIGEQSIPSCWNLDGRVVEFSKEFTVPNELEGSNFQLVFWGARQNLTVHLNDRLLDAWQSDWPTTEISLP